MRNVITPEINMVRNSFGRKYLPKLNGSLRRFVVSLNRENVDMLL